MTKDVRPVATLVRWFGEKRFGFMRLPDEPRDIFVHASELPDEHPTIGDQFFVSIEHVTRGLAAMNCQRCGRS